MTTEQPTEHTIAAVVIGRNEGERLVDCLASIQGKVATVVYVDSGSTDDSIAVGRRAGATVVELDTNIPFTAARARNAGVTALRKAGSVPSFVLFIDGDCTLHPDFVSQATRFLLERTDAAVACGRRREKVPATSIYNRLIDMEWNTAIGPARACGGDSLMRLAAFEAVNGFDGSLIAGEEPELCFRLRRAGWTIWRLDIEMTRHDAAMTRFGQWWRRAVRGGWAYAEGTARHGSSPEGYNQRALQSIVLWGGIVPALGLAGLLAAPFGVTAGLAISAMAALAILVQALRIARYRHGRFGDPWPDALAYGAFTMIGKLPQILGAIRYWRSRRQVGPAHIIEYKA